MDVTVTVTAGDGGNDVWGQNKEVIVIVDVGQIRVFGDGEDGGGQKSILVVYVVVVTQTGTEDNEGRGGVTTAEDDGDVRGTDGEGGILGDVLGGVGDTLGIDGLDEVAGAAGLVEMPGTFLVEV